MSFKARHRCPLEATVGRKRDPHHGRLTRVWEAGDVFFEPLGSAAVTEPQWMLADQRSAMNTSHDPRPGICWAIEYETSSEPRSFEPTPSRKNAQSLTC